LDACLSVGSELYRELLAHSICCDPGARLGVAGVLAPVLTPFQKDLSLDSARFLRHCRWLLSQACAGLAVFGTTISPYLLFWQASQEAEDIRAVPERQILKRAPDQGPEALKRIELDTLIGMGISNFIALAIILTTAATLNVSGVTDIETSAQAAEALRPIAGNYAATIFDAYSEALSSIARHTHASRIAIAGPGGAPGPPPQPRTGCRVGQSGWWAISQTKHASSRATATCASSISARASGSEAPVWARACPGRSRCPFRRRSHRHWSPSRDRSCHRTLRRDSGSRAR